MEDPQSSDEYTISVEEARDAVSGAIKLLGNASSQISRLRRKKILKAVNPSIQDLAEEDLFSGSAPNLFGSGFERKMKDRAKSMKLIASASKPPPGPKKFFVGAAPLPPREEAAKPGAGGDSKGGTSRARPPSDSPQDKPDNHRQRPTCYNYISEYKCNSNLSGSEGGHNLRGHFTCKGDNCRKINTLPQKLVKGHPRPMGPEHDSGVQARTPQGTCTNYPPQRGNSINLGAEPYRRGDPKDASERGHHRDTPGGSKTGLLLKPLSGSKERWRHEAGNKPKTPQRVRCPTPFQNGGDPHPERPAEEERLDDQSRSKRCLLHDPNSHLQQTSSSVLGERLPLSVHMPAIRPVQRSLGLYQDPEASDNPAQRARGKVSDLHRRYSRHGGDTEMARDHTLGLIYLLENLGFIVHPEKTQSTQHRR